jgi:rubrerythrin
MDLGTTGSILSFALKRETEVSAFYRRYISLVSNSNLREAFELLQKAQQKRERLLNRFRRENVTEMILEPIQGFASEAFELAISSEDSPDDSSLLASAIKIEESSCSFFLKASEKTTFLPEVSDEFKRLSDKAENNVALLKSIS